MTQQEYSDALEYLLTSLSAIQAQEIVIEITEQLRRGKTQEISATDLKEKKINQKDVGTTQTLPLDPQEAFEMAIEYLKSIIIEVPLYAEKISGLFGNNIIWNPDQDERIQFTFSEFKFSLNDISYKNSEIDEARNEIKIIKQLISE
jgi:hypothetical protein